MEFIFLSSLPQLEMTKSVGRKGVDEAEYFLSQVNSINLGLLLT